MGDWDELSKYTYGCHEGIIFARRGILADELMMPIASIVPKNDSASGESDIFWYRRGSGDPLRDRLHQICRLVQDFCIALISLQRKELTIELANGARPYPAVAILTLWKEIVDGQVERTSVSADGIFFYDEDLVNATIALRMLQIVSCRRNFLIREVSDVNSVDLVDIMPRLRRRIHCRPEVHHSYFPYFSYPDIVVPADCNVYGTYLNDAQVTDDTTLRPLRHTVFVLLCVGHVRIFVACNPHSDSAQHQSMALFACHAYLFAMENSLAKETFPGKPIEHASALCTYLIFRALVYANEAASQKYHIPNALLRSSFCGGLTMLNKDRQPVAYFVPLGDISAVIVPNTTLWAELPVVRRAIASSKGLEDTAIEDTDLKGEPRQPLTEFREMSPLVYWFRALRFTFCFQTWQRNEPFAVAIVARDTVKQRPAESEALYRHSSDLMGELMRLSRRFIKAKRLQEQLTDHLSIRLKIRLLGTELRAGFETVSQFKQLFYGRFNSTELRYIDQAKEWHPVVVEMGLYFRDPVETVRKCIRDIDRNTRETRRTREEFDAMTFEDRQTHWRYDRSGRVVVDPDTIQLIKRAELKPFEGTVMSLLMVFTVI